MKTTIEYTGTEQEKSDKALADCLEYLGKKRYDLFLGGLRHAFFNAIGNGEKKKAHVEHVADVMGMVAGIEGYPLTAMINEAIKGLIDQDLYKVVREYDGVVQDQSVETPLYCGTRESCLEYMNNMTVAAWNRHNTGKNSIGLLSLTTGRMVSYVLN